MNLISISKTFKKLYDSNKLSHFYILRYDITENISEFYSLLLNNITGKDLNSHPDFHRLKIDDNEKSYKVDSKNIEIFNKFIGQNPINLDHKFVVFEDGHLVSEVLLNKLLKTFEELNSKITVILLVPKNEPLIPTIKSRSIEIYLNHAQESKQSKIDASQIQSLLKKGSISLEDVVSNIVGHENLNFRQANQMLSSIKKASAFKNFNHQESVLLELIMP